jgi:hypothetical protein
MSRIAAFQPLLDGGYEPPADPRIYGRCWHFFLIRAVSQSGQGSSEARDDFDPKRTSAAYANDH